MNLEFTHLLPKDFHETSRVWVYQASRLLSLGEALETESLLAKFAAEWRSHGAEVDAYANLFFGQFVVLMVDERRAGISGCSTDSSVRFMKELGQRFGIDFFNRTALAFVVKDKVQTLPLNQVQYALDNGFISPDTIYFNNLVQTKKELENGWLVPVKDSWLAARIKLPSAG